MRKVNFVYGIAGAIYSCVLMFVLILVCQPRICQSSDGVSEMATKKSMNETWGRGGLKSNGTVPREMSEKGLWFRGGIRGGNKTFSMVRSDNENSSRTKGKWSRGGLQNSHKIELEGLNITQNNSK